VQREILLFGRVDDSARLEHMARTSRIDIGPGETRAAFFRRMYGAALTPTQAKGRVESLFGRTSGSDPTAKAEVATGKGGNESSDWAGGFILICEWVNAADPKLQPVATTQWDAVRRMKPGFDPAKGSMGGHRWHAQLPSIRVKDAIPLMPLLARHNVGHGRAAAAIWKEACLAAMSAGWAYDGDCLQGHAPAPSAASGSSGDADSTARIDSEGNSFMEPGWAGEWAGGSQGPRLCRVQTRPLQRGCSSTSSKSEPARAVPWDIRLIIPLPRVVAIDQSACQTIRRANAASE